MSHPGGSRAKENTLIPFYQNICVAWTACLILVRVVVMLYGGVAREAYLHTSKQVVVTSLLGNKRKTLEQTADGNNWGHLVIYIYTHSSICFALFGIIFLFELRVCVDRSV